MKTAIGIALFVLLFLSIALGYGISSQDISRLEQFALASDRWASNSDFRQICREYIHYSVEAMRIRIMGAPASRCIMALRSTPGLPDWLTVNETSQRHYDNFSRGELSAYLHLCGEQGTDLFLSTLESMAKKEPLSDEEVRQFLESFHLSAPVSHDAAAIKSVRRLLQETHAAQAFGVRVKTDAGLLMPHIDALARARQIPADPVEMTPPQQREILDALDPLIASSDPSLWRTKQVTDFLSGVWGQAYAQIYRDYAIRPLLRLHRIGLWSTWGCLAMVLWWMWRSVRQLRVSRASGAITSNP